jgi:hypothetical protein
VRLVRDPYCRQLIGTQQLDHRVRCVVELAR